MLAHAHQPKRHAECMFPCQMGRTILFIVFLVKFELRMNETLRHRKEERKKEKTQPSIAAHIARL